MTCPRGRASHRNDGPRPCSVSPAGAGPFCGVLGWDPTQRSLSLCSTGRASLRPGAARVGLGCPGGRGPGAAWSSSWPPPCPTLPPRPRLARLLPCSQNTCRSFLGRQAARASRGGVQGETRVLSSVATAACPPVVALWLGKARWWPRPRPLLRGPCVGRKLSTQDSWPDLAQGTPSARVRGLLGLRSASAGGSLRGRSRPRPRAVRAARPATGALTLVVVRRPSVPWVPLGFCDVLVRFPQTRGHRDALAVS